MHKNTTHILNGDALLAQFPEDISSNPIIARLGLVDGNVKANSLEELFLVRHQHICKYFEDVTFESYQQKVITELSKIKATPNKNDIILWFEKDLFCQVNFWFLLDYIETHKLKNTLYLVLPSKNPYGFGGLSKAELTICYQNKIKLTKLPVLNQLWKAYQAEDLILLQELANELESEYPFIKTAVNAHLDRIPTKHSLGKPKETLKQIIKELNTTDFGKVFQEFCKREAIYGFGDLQVKRMFEEIVK